MATQVDSICSDESLQRAREVYRDALQMGLPAREQRGTGGVWLPDPDRSAREVQELVAEAECSPSCQVLKKGRHGAVMRSELGGRDALIKFYDVTGVARKLKYWPRLSRGHRAFAAAVGLGALDVPTPEPLGYLEQSRRGLPFRSYFITSFVDDACTARGWLEQHYAVSSTGAQEAFRRRLREAITNLYRHGVYHADTKTLNMLVLDPGLTEAKGLAWVDLECVRFGVRPTRNRVLRNLVQLRGSLPDAVPEADREAFVGEYAEVFPWVNSRGVRRTIARRTRWRLQKEAWGWDQP